MNDHTHTINETNEHVEVDGLVNEDWIFVLISITFYVPYLIILINMRFKPYLMKEVLHAFVVALQNTSRLRLRLVLSFSFEE